MTRVSWTITQKQKTQIIKGYLDGVSMKKLCVLSGVTRASIYRIVRSQRVRLRPKYAKVERFRTINESAFSRIDESAAYWCGFLVADGGIYCPQEKKWAPRITLDLGIKDIHHVRMFKKYVRAEHPIRISHNGQSAVLSFCSWPIGERLRMLGVVGSKSGRAKFDRMLITSRHFWRGVVDGDGTVCIARLYERGRPCVSLVGYKKLLELFARFVRSNGILTEATVRPLKGKKICGINIGEIHAYRLIVLLYKGCSVALGRKTKIANHIMKIFGKRYKGQNDSRSRR